MDFTCKARFVAGRHMIEIPIALYYSRIVSYNSIMVKFFVAVLNGLSIYACDIGSAYMNAPCMEKILLVTGLKCGQSLKRSAMHHQKL